MLDPSIFIRSFQNICPIIFRGKVSEIKGPILKATLQGVSIGDFVFVSRRMSDRRNYRPSSRAESAINPENILSQVVGVQEEVCILSPLDHVENILPGAHVEAARYPIQQKSGLHLIGTVIDRLGRIIKTSRQPDTLRAIFQNREAPSPLSTTLNTYKISQPKPSAHTRCRINEPFITGIRAIDGFLTLGFGQRIAIFAEPGVGKTTLMGTICRQSSADVNVVALIGERSREVGEFLNHTLDENTRSRTTVVVSTSDETAASRVLAAETATKIAEHFRDAFGLHVLLQMDSLTRLFRAYREIGLGAGEIPVRRGYPPSLFAKLPELLERAGTGVSYGSVTALYTVLLSSDLDEDPMVEELKGLLDGHFILRRELAEQGQHPAIDVLASISRLTGRLLEKDVLEATRVLRALMARLHRDREMILLGAKPDFELSQALALEPEIRGFLQQDEDEVSDFRETKERILELVGGIRK